MSGTTPATGAISFLDLQTIFGGTNPISFSEYYADNGLTTGVEGIPNTGISISMSQMRGKTKTLIKIQVSLSDCGLNHTVFLDENGNVYSCGNNISGQLGIGNKEQKESPVSVDSLSNIVQISCGASHTVFLDGNGNVYSCGDNNYGQLGIGDNTEPQTSPVRTPVSVDVLSNIVQISCGAYHTVFLDENRNVYSCGYNAYGQLGIGNTEELEEELPVSVDSLSNIVQISCGWSHTLFLDENRNVYSCGDNSNGQLGISNTDSDPKKLPVSVDSLSNIVQISCGASHTVFLDENGNVYSCGNNYSGQLGIGDGDRSQRDLPVSVDSLSNIVHISCGVYYTVFLDENGNVFSCGDNYYGQLGISNTHWTDWRKISPESVEILI